MMMMILRMGNEWSRCSRKRTLLVHVILTDVDIIWTRKYEILVIVAIVTIVGRGTLLSVIVIIVVMDVTVFFFFFRGRVRRFW